VRAVTSRSDEFEDVRDKAGAVVQDFFRNILAEISEKLV
jgi:hypothetical protein